MLIAVLNKARPKPSLEHERVANTFTPNSLSAQRDIPSCGINHDPDRATLPDLSRQKYRALLATLRAWHSRHFLPIVFLISQKTWSLLKSSTALEM
ncbi:hypothetical protein J6590_031030 [Homalodisca vitripennis]|nr:hypothetical protein J6590_031030 [Homalodisca vitripennis]